MNFHLFIFKSYIFGFIRMNLYEYTNECIPGTFENQWIGKTLCQTFILKAYFFESINMIFYE